MNQESRHILRDFDLAIRKLRDEVIAMGGIARLNLERAMQGLTTRDLDLCRMVIADDTDVDEAERRIDSLGMDILIRFHPVASDLRLVISSMKIASNLERISDHAVNIAKRAKKIINHPEFSEVHMLEPLHGMAAGQLENAMISFTDRSATIGASLPAQDKELDRAEKRLASEFSGRLEEGGDRAEDYLHLIFVARSLERVGDLAVNIGEDAVFLDSAQDIRHMKRSQIREEVPGLSGE